MFVRRREYPSYRVRGMELCGRVRERKAFNVRRRPLRAPRVTARAKCQTICRVIYNFHLRPMDFCEKTTRRKRHRLASLERSRVARRPRTYMCNFPGRAHARARSHADLH